MTYQIIAHPRVQREIKKLHKKDKVLYEHSKITLISFEHHDDAYK